MFPAAATFFTLIVKYTNKTLKLDGDDWMQGYNLIFGFVCTLIGIASWLTHEGTFSWTYLYQGAISGTCTMIGATFAVYALNIDGAPQGVKVAVM